VCGGCCSTGWVRFTAFPSGSLDVRDALPPRHVMRRPEHTSTPGPDPGQDLIDGFDAAAEQDPLRRAGHDTGIGHDPALGFAEPKTQIERRPVRGDAGGFHRTQQGRVEPREANTGG
jgi:hypothetical protein